MSGFDIMLKLLLLYLLSVCVILPLPGENGISLPPTPLHPSNVTAPTPPDPPSFNVDIVFADYVPMRPLAFYPAVIWLMYQFSVQLWAEPANLSKAATLTYLDLTIVTIALNGLALTAGHCVLALHKIILAVYGPPARYDYVVAAITLKGFFIGHMIIDSFVENHHNSRYSPHMPIVLNQPPASGNASLSVEDSGTIIDMEYKMLRVTYRYEGRPIRSEEIFTAAVDGLTTLAPYGERSNECASVSGISGSGAVDFHVSSTNRGVKVTSCFVLKCTLALITLWLMVPANRYGELDFSVKYVGTEVATGYVYKSGIPRVGARDSTGGIASS